MTTVTTTDPVIAARSRLGVEVRTKGAKSTGAENARRDLAAALIEKRIQEIATSAPPLTPSQRARLSALIASVGPTANDSGGGAESVAGSVAPAPSLRRGAAAPSSDALRAPESQGQPVEGVER